MSDESNRSVVVLITGAGTVTCQSVIKALRAQDEFDVRIITVDSSPANAGRYFSDHFETVPRADEPDFIPHLLTICRQQEVDLLIPIVDYEFVKLAEAKAAFADFGCRVVLSDAATIETCNDKWKTFHFFCEHGVQTPTTWLPGSLRRDELRYPVFVKPRLMGRGSIDAHQVNSPEELDRLLSAIDSPLVQEVATGDEFTVDVLCDFSGRAVNAVVRERTETKAGVSYKGITVRNPEILDQAVAIAEALPIIGPANIQCFWNQGQATFFEVNPRYSGALTLSVAAGFNSPLSVLRLHAGMDFSHGIGAYQEDVRMYRFWQEVFVDAAGNHPTLPFEPALTP